MYDSTLKSKMIILI